MDEIYLTGSKKTIKRKVYEIEDGKYIVKFYDEFIYVEKGLYFWRTVGLY